MTRRSVIGALTMLALLLGASSAQATVGDWSTPLTLHAGGKGLPVQHLAIGADGTIAAAVYVGADNAEPPLSPARDSVWVIPRSGSGHRVWTGSERESLLDVGFLGSTPFLLTQTVKAFGGSSGRMCCSIAQVQKVSGGTVRPAITIDEDLTQSITGALVPVGNRLLGVLFSYGGLSATWRSVTGSWSPPQLVETARAERYIVQGFPPMAASAGNRVAVSSGEDFVYTATTAGRFSTLPLPLGPEPVSLAVSGDRTSIAGDAPGSVNEVGDVTSAGFTSQLSVPGGFYYDLQQIAGDAEGDEIYAWQPCAPDCPLEAVFRRGDGPFSTPVVLGANPGFLQVAMTGAGTGIIAWISGDSVMASVLAPDSTAFSTPEQISSHAAPPDYANLDSPLVLATASGDNAALSWLNSSHDVEISRFRP